jgi:hypothetical protein
MSNPETIPVRLSDTQLILLSEAARHAQHALIVPDRLKGEAAKKVVRKLLNSSLIAETPATDGLPIWRRDEQGAPVSLVITDTGLAAIHAGEPEEPDTTPAAAAKSVGNAPKKGAPPKPTARKGKVQNPTSPGQGKARGVVSRSGKAAAPSSSGRSGSKQDRVLAMLRSKSGATVAAIMEATGWQRHSVRGFFSGVIRKRLNLDLTADGDGEKRTYRVGSVASVAVAAGSSKRRARA